MGKVTLVTSPDVTQPPLVKGEPEVSATSGVKGLETFADSVVEDVGDSEPELVVTFVHSLRTNEYVVVEPFVVAMVTYETTVPYTPVEAL
jgi:hypothetical protein